MCCREHLLFFMIVTKIRMYRETVKIQFEIYENPSGGIGYCTDIIKLAVYFFMRTHQNYLVRTSQRKRSVSIASISIVNVVEEIIDVYCGSKTLGNR
jgi:hypothetical protein